MGVLWFKEMNKKEITEGGSSEQKFESRIKAMGVDLAVVYKVELDNGYEVPIAYPVLEEIYLLNVSTSTYDKNIDPNIIDLLGNSSLLIIEEKITQILNPYELILGMSRDELFENLKHIDRNYYGNHYFSPNKTNEVSADEFQDWES
jgi:hypothetical protein